MQDVVKADPERFALLFGFADAPEALVPIAAEAGLGIVGEEEVDAERPPSAKHATRSDTAIAAARRIG